MSTARGPGLGRFQPGSCSLRFVLLSPKDAQLQNAEKLKACEEKMFSGQRGFLLLQTSEINAGCKITHDSQECLQPEQCTRVGLS